MFYLLGCFLLSKAKQKIYVDGIIIIIIIFNYILSSEETLKPFSIENTKKNQLT